MSAKLSTGMEEKLYLPFYSFLITLILGIMALCWWTHHTNCLLILPMWLRDTSK